jgi:transmembrane sensor
MENEHIWTLIAKKLSGEASASDLKELESALRMDPDLHYSLEALNDLWKTRRPQPTENTELAFQKHMERMRGRGLEMGTPENSVTFDEPTAKRLLLQKIKKPAITVLALGIVIATFNFLKPASSAPVLPKPQWEVVTRNGSKTNLLLPDGTSVWLNAGSRLTYDSLYGTNNREVSLSGEGYFDVIKNPKKPFIIHTGKINIKVLGTVFNVKSYPGEKTIETSLIRGSIEVSFPFLSSKKIILKDNQKLVIDKSDPVSDNQSSHTTPASVPFFTIQHLNKKGSDSIITETGWMQNRLFFNDMSFKELLMVMERKYGVTFKLADAGLDTIHFTGSFQNETVSQALDALRLTAEKSTTDFTFQMEGNQVTIYNNSGVHSNQAQ